MWIDTHVHLLDSKKSRPNWAEIDLTLKVAAKKGIDIICLTEHRDSLGFSELYDEVFVENKLNGEIRDDGVVELKSGLMISPGAEVSLVGGGDIGVHASLAEVMKLSDQPMAYRAVDVLDQLDSGSGDYVTVAHHLLGAGKWWREFESVIQRVSAIEVPGKHSRFIDRYKILARQYAKACVCGSDAHTWIQVGVGRTLAAGVLSKLDAIAFVTKLKNDTGCQITVAHVDNAAEEVLKLSGMYREVRRM